MRKKMPDRIIKESDDVIILDNLNGLLVFFLILAFILWISLNEWAFIIFLILFIILAFVIFLSYETVTMDKKLQSVVIKNFFNVKNLDFSNIVRIDINDNSDSESSAWSINITTIHGKLIKVYSTGSESDAEKVAKKIAKITNISIPHNDKGQDYFRKNKQCPVDVI